MKTCACVCVCVVEQSYLTRECLHPICTQQPIAHSQMCVCVSSLYYVHVRIKRSRINRIFKLYFEQLKFIGRAMFMKWVRILAAAVGAVA